MKIEQFGKITLIHGDCMEYLRQCKDKQFQIAVCDPPYSKASGNVERTGGTWASKYGKNIKTWDIAPTDEYFRELSRVADNQIIWGGNYFRLPPTRCFLVWRKLSISYSFSMAMCEYAWTSFDGNAKCFESAPQGTKNDPRFHPTQKPVALYAWIYNNYCKGGDTIIDTHLGSGSSAIAALALGHEFVGIEIDEIYYEKAKERLLKRMAQKSLFEDI